MKKTVYKVPNGKLLKISLSDEGGKISKLTITGDFFMYPEESLVELEKALFGAKIEEKNLQEIIEDFMTRTHSTFYGLDAQSLAQTIVSASNSPLP